MKNLELGLSLPAKRYGEDLQTTLRTLLTTPKYDDTARRINLADNKLAELGYYDEEDLATMLAALDDTNRLAESFLFDVLQKSGGFTLSQRDNNFVHAIVLGELSDGMEQNRSAAELEELFALTAGRNGRHARA